jgi:hypothetical protein
MRWIVCFLSSVLFCSVSLPGAVSLNLGNPSSTEVMLTIHLTAPTGSACTVEVATDQAYSSLINDVNALLFTNANKSDRGNGSWIASPSTHYFKIGTRGRAYKGLDGRYYSRVPAAASLLYIRVNNDSACDPGGPANATVTMGTIPYGQMYMDAIPTDPANPGVTAWPELRGTLRTPYTDPQTGLQYTPITVPGDLPFQTNSGVNFGAAYDGTGTWALSRGALPATFSGSNSAKLFLPVDPAQSGAPTFGSLGYTYEYIVSASMDYFYAHLTAYCSGRTCSSAAGPNKTLDACLSVNGVTCASATIKVVLPSRSAVNHFGGTKYGMTDWMPWSTPINHVNAKLQTTSVTINGANVTYDDSTNREFRTSWTGGTRATLDSGCASPVTIASVTDVRHLTLTGAPGCTKANMSILQLGLLVWKDTASTDQFTLTAANYDYALDNEAQADSSAMQDFINSTGGPPITVGDCVGYLAYHTQAFYWESAQCGRVNYLGQWTISKVARAPTQTLPAGGANSGGGVCAFDPNKAGLIYCGLVMYCVGANNCDTGLIKVQFSGPYTNNATPGAAIASTTGSSCTPSPCLAVTLLESSLIGRAMTFSPAFAASCCAGFAPPEVSGQNADGTFQIQFKNATTQNQTGWESVYDPAVPGFIAIRPTTNEASSIHSVVPCHGTLVCYGAQLGDLTGAGPLSGNGSYPLDGPFRVRVPAGIPRAGSPCGSRPTVIPAIFWAGGSQNVGPNSCVTVTVASNVLADPSPFSISIPVTVTNGSASISTSGASNSFVRIYAGKPILINGSVYKFAAWPGGWTSDTQMTLSSSFTGASGTYTATLYADPTCAQDAVVCDVPTDHDLRTIQVGDVLFVGQPTAGVTGYNTCTLTEDASRSECFLVTAVSATTPAANATITLQHGYSKNSKLQAWPANTYLYLGSPFDNYAIDQNNVGYNTGWDYRNYPNGEFVLSSSMDLNPPIGHNYTTANGTAGFEDSTGSGCLKNTLWNGLSSVNCYGIRYNPPTNFNYAGLPVLTRPYSAPFARLLGIGDNVDDQVDDHPTLPYLSQKRFILGARNLNGGGVTSADIPCTVLSGTLYRCSAAQQGFASPALAIAAQKTLPTHLFCGQSVLSNISGPAAVIDGTSVHNYQVVMVLHAGEGYAGSSAGDALVNCPYVVNRYSFAGPADRTSGQSGTLGDGGDQVDINVIPGSCCAHVLTQIDFSNSASSLDGSAVRVLGHGLWRYHWYSVFAACRATPDGLGCEEEAVGVDGFKTQILLVTFPPSVFDSINRTGFINMPVPVSADGSPYAIIEFGYAENGDPQMGLYCTARQEACRTKPGSGDPFQYASEAQFPTSCSGGCTLNIPGISQRKLFYRVLRTDSKGGVQTSGPLQWVDVP